MRKNRRTSVQLDHLELRRLLSTIYVDAIAPGPTNDGSSWANAYTDLQQALSAATSGTVIEVAQGTYTPTAGTDRTATFQLINGVTIDGGYAGYGQSNPDARDTTLYPTMLSGDIGAHDSYHVVTGSGTDATAVLDGVTVTSGYAQSTPDEGGGLLNISGSPTLNDCTITGNFSSGSGGGVYDESSSPTFTDCTITGNFAKVAGGGILNAASSSPTFTDCTISQNISNGHGGGISNDSSTPTLTTCTITGNSSSAGGGMYNSASTPVLTNTTISSNKALNGAGTYNKNSPATLTGCTIDQNTATGSGAGMFNEDSAVALSNSTITGNAAATQGGGLYDSETSSPTLIDCTLSGNSAGNGGAIADDSTTLQLTNCIITGNAATTGNGGGLFEISSTATLLNCTVTGNTATHGAGGGIYGDGSLTVTNSILWNDSAPTGGEIFGIGGTVTITFSDVDQSETTGTGVVDADPLFARNVGTNGASDFGDVHLQTGSPAINAGSNTAISGTMTDVAGNARIVGGIVDLGAYEAQSVTPIYVDKSATGSGTGATWANAFTDLQTALGTIVGAATIDVAQGTYYPTTGSDRGATFELQSGVAIYGGFAGDTTSAPGQRDVSTYPTILSGDIGTTGDNSDNSYHVVSSDSSTDSSAILDGFTITAGNADGSGPASEGSGINNNFGSPTINDCTVTGNSAAVGAGILNNYSSAALTNCTITGNTTTAPYGLGAGIYDDYSSVTLINCTISGNTGARGAGITNIGSAPVLIDCVITGNTATGGNGGGLANYSSSPTLTNCTISGNTATGDGGGMYDYSASPTLVNCILWGDTAASGNEIFDDVNSTSTVTYSDVDQSGFTGMGDIDTNPEFVRAVGANGMSDLGDLHLLGTSSAINAGSNAAISGTTTDADGNARVVEGTVDMGAYEAFPTHLAILTEPAASSTAGSDIPITVQVEDQYGSVFAADNSIVAISLGMAPSGASLGGTSNAVTQNGVATFDGFFLTKAGDYTLSFTDGSLTGATSASFVVNAAPAKMLAFTNQPTNTTAGQTLSPVVVEVEDQYGNPVVGDTSTVTLTSTPAEISATTAANIGIAAFSNLSATQAGTYTLTATDGSLTAATSSSFEILPGAPASVTIEQQPANALAGQALAPITIEVEDQYGNLADGSSVTLAVATGPSGATLGGTFTMPTTGGIATFSDLTLDRAGTFTLSATDGSLPAAASNSFNITYAGPQLVFVVEPTTTSAGAKISSIHVSPEDINGNPLTSNKSKIKLTLSSGGKLMGGAIGHVKNGVAIFSKLSIRAAGIYTLTATDPTFGTAVSTTFTITPAAAKKLAFNPQPGGVANGTPFNASVDLFDRYGNLATDDTSTVELTLGSHPKTATFTNLMASVTDGMADFDDVVLTVPGKYTLSAIDGKLKAKSKPFTVS